MKIVVCVKHVPDIQSERTIGDDGRVARDGGDGTLNELDENAIEAALVLAETHGGEVVVLTAGPADAVDAVRRGLQMGADEAVHVLDGALAGSDVFGTAAVLAAFNVARALGAFWRLGDLVGLVVALGLTGWALRSGRTVDALGLGRDRVRAGLAWGGGAFAQALTG